METMEKSQLLVNIESGYTTLSSISNNDFKMLMSDPQTKSYGLMLCSQAYCLKVMESLNEHMDKIALNDDINQQMLFETYNLVRRDAQGQIYINGAESALLFYDYFNKAFLSMWDIEKGKPNLLQIIINIFNFRRDFKETKLYIDIAEQADFIKSKYITSTDSNCNLSTIIRNGWDELQKELETNEFLESLEYCDGVEEYFELAVSNIGSLESLFSQLEDDLQPLKKLLDDRRKFYYVD